jgi:hypothetical protein
LAFRNVERTPRANQTAIAVHPERRSPARLTADDAKQDRVT